MLSWAIKSNIFIIFCKKNCFYKKESLEKRYCLLYFVLDSCHKKARLESFHMKYIRTVRDHVRVYILFLSLGILSEKWTSWSTSPTFKHISEENHKFKLTYL